MTPWKVLVSIHERATRLVLGRRLVKKNETETADCAARMKRLREMADHLDNCTIEVARESGILVGAGVTADDDAIPEHHAAIHEAAARGEGIDTPGIRGDGLDAERVRELSDHLKAEEAKETQ